MKCLKLLKLIIEKNAIIYQLRKDRLERDSSREEAILKNIMLEEQLWQLRKRISLGLIGGKDE